MTAITPESIDGSMLRVISASMTQRRLSELVREPVGRAEWWVEITRELDDLAESVCEGPGDMVDPVGFGEQIRSDAPHLMTRWSRLAADSDDLYREVCDVRLQASRYAGDPIAVNAVCRAISDLLAHVERFQRRTTDLLLEAYERDLGGE